MRVKPTHQSVRALVIIGDTHFGSTMGLMPPRMMLPDGQHLYASPIQRQIWKYWGQFWDFVEDITQNQFILVHNGDLCDGRHHHTLQLTTGNLSWQQFVAESVLRPKVQLARGYYQLAGTPAHSGESNEVDEMVAKNLGAKVVHGRYTPTSLWITLGRERIHIAHHIPHSGSHAYKSSPAMRLMALAFADAGERGLKPPTLLIRSHSHDYIEVKRPNCRVVVCPSWQGKTDWSASRDSITEPWIGGLVVRQGEHGVHIREFTKTLPRPKPETI